MYITKQQKQVKMTDPGAVAASERTRQLVQTYILYVPFSIKRKKKSSFYCSSDSTLQMSE